MSLARPIGLAYPKGTYKVVPFYWRGDDPLKEQEALILEYRQTQIDYRKKEEELNAAKLEYEMFQSKLDSCDQYAIQIANDLGEKSTSTPQNAQIRAEIKSLQEQIKNTQKEIAYCKFWIAPTEQTKLLTEDLGLWPEIETQYRNLGQLASSIDSIQEEIGKSIISSQYMYSANTIVEARVAQHCKNWLSVKLQRLRNSMNQKKSNKNGVRMTAASSLVHSNVEINRIVDLSCGVKLESEEVQLKRELALIHRKQSINAALQTITELNEVIAMLGGKPIDTQKVMKKCGNLDFLGNDVEKSSQNKKTSGQKTNSKQRNFRAAPKSSLAPKVHKKSK